MLNAADFSRRVGDKQANPAKINKEFAGVPATPGFGVERLRRWCLQGAE
jgi:hypothetical protein